MNPAKSLLIGPNPGDGSQENEYPGGYLNFLLGIKRGWNLGREFGPNFDHERIPEIAQGG